MEGVSDRLVPYLVTARYQDRDYTTFVVMAESPERALDTIWRKGFAFGNRLDPILKLRVTRVFEKSAGR